MKKDEAVAHMQEDISNLKECAIQFGWKEVEFHNRMTEVFKNFPWYQYITIEESFLSRLVTLSMYMLILYLTSVIVLNHNIKIKRTFENYLYENQYMYHKHRLFRLISLPIHQLYDLSRWYRRDCLIWNPLAYKWLEPVRCTFCKNIDTILAYSQNNEIYKIINDGKPAVLYNVVQYHNISVGFNDIKSLFTKHGVELDNAICEIKLTESFTKVSDYFRMNETEVEHLSIGWRNCDTYGTRFYRTLFSRPSFIPKHVEIYIEKQVYIVQQNRNFSVPMMLGKATYISQIQGESVFQMQVNSKCHKNCTRTPLEVVLKHGHIVVFPNNGWIISLKSISKKLSIIYISSFG